MHMSMHMHRVSRAIRRLLWPCHHAIMYFIYGFTVVKGVSRLCDRFGQYGIKVGTLGAPMGPPQNRDLNVEKIRKPPPLPIRLYPSWGELEDYTLV